MQDAYATAGVNIDAGNKAVELMKDALTSTKNSNVLEELGGFGSLFKLSGNYKKPVLVCGSDGVGSKLLIAIEANKHDTIGQDLVAMVANDILAQGAKPLFMLDYMGINKVKPNQVAQIVKGIAAACKLSNMALIGGETAELPDLYAKDHYDLAGFALGVVEEEKMLKGKNVQVGDVVLGLTSSGLHSNGFSLVRKLIFDNQNKKWNDLTKTQQDILLTPTKLYANLVLPLIEQHLVVSAAHITGGGLVENIPRALGDNLGVEISFDNWEIPTVFKDLGILGKLSKQEMLRTFNLGIGFVLIVKAKNVNTIKEILAKQQENVFELGNVVADEKKRVVVKGDLNYGN